MDFLRLLISSGMIFVSELSSRPPSYHHHHPSSILVIIGQFVKLSLVERLKGNDVEVCRSEKVLVQPNMCVFLQYSVMP